MKKNSLLALFLLFFISNGIAQNKKEFRVKLDSIIEMIKKNKTYYSYDFSKYSKKFPKYVIDKTKKYLYSTNTDFHFFSINLIGDAALQSEKLNVRREGVFQLVNTYKNSLHMCADKLKKFKKEDFDDRSKDSLIAFLSVKEKRFTVIKLIGYLDMIEQIPTLKTFFDLPELKGTVRGDKLRWDINIVLARLGDEGGINACIEKAKPYACEKLAVYRLFPDLVYTRNKKIFDYLVSILHDTSAQTQSANPNRNAIISCGYRVMELFPKIVEGYPLEHSIGKQIKTNNYKEALKTAREWFIKNPDYKISRDTF